MCDYYSVVKVGMLKIEKTPTFFLVAHTSAPRTRAPAAAAVTTITTNWRIIASIDERWEVTFLQSQVKICCALSPRWCMWFTTIQLHCSFYTHLITSFQRESFRCVACNSWASRSDIYRSNWLILSLKVRFLFNFRSVFLFNFATSLIISQTNQRLLKKRKSIRTENCIKYHSLFTIQA